MTLSVIFGMVLPWLLLGLSCWIGYQLVLQNGRILLKMDVLEAQIKQLTAASPRANAPKSQLPFGSPAPAFELPDLEGNRHKLESFLGRRILLIFFNPKCGYCAKMAPDLAALPTDGKNDRPLPLVISTGDSDSNRRLFEEHGIRCPVLLQKSMEVGVQYKSNGTPTGYLIDEQGKIASDLAVGADALLALFVAPIPPPREEIVEASVNGEKHDCGCKNKKKGKADKGLAHSRVNRSGLHAGTPAPAFRLPRVGGGEVSLEDYRGRRTLLVFSDPDCGPCDRLAPELERMHRQRKDINVLMLSRRDPELNRKKVKELGLTFPVVMQKSWEISMLYGIFATPVGYLIDEQGVIDAEVARGVEQILALADSEEASRHSRKEVATI